ncbi:response regulator transcription factor [Cohnella hongkongensis]|uniref:Response regulator n=1 Tax=Cohnella hongkongensis TaxID=178337 RepID=A0ABV9F5P0_9BACL
MFNVLIVDDEVNVLESLEQLVPWERYDVGTVYKASTGEEALAVMESRIIDIVIADINMPVMTGLELIEQIRTRWKRARCILLTGYAEFEYARQAISHNIADYLLKPVSDDEIAASLTKVTNQIRQEISEEDTYRRAVQAFRESLPRLRGELLYELLQGARMSPERLVRRLEMLELPVRPGDPFALMLIRLEEDLTDYDVRSMSLLEYAIGNMAEEIFGDRFRLWQTKDLHDYMVFLVTVHDGLKRDADDSLLQRLAAQFQQSVKHYLKSKISVLNSRWGSFPSELTPQYQKAVYAFRSQIGSEREMFTSMGADEGGQAEFGSLHSLYELPLLHHLLEAGNWQAAERKLEAVLEELDEKWIRSKEYMLATFFSLYASFGQFAHKSGCELSEIVGGDPAGGDELQPARSVHSLRRWASQTLGKVRSHAERATASVRDRTIRRIQDYVQRNLNGDVSLQTIADELGTHPVHVSRVYKLEMGENLSEYIARLKMEKAAHLLTSSTGKIYEIALQLGYMNPNYFIKVFKKYYGLTPQEYRQHRQQ